MYKDELNNWDVSYSAISFFENALHANYTVDNFVRTKDIFFTITKNDMFELTVVLVNRYTLGLADIFKAQQEFGKFDCIVTSGEWNGYTPEAKEWGLKNKKGVFIPSEFFAAISEEYFWNFAKRDKHGKPVYKYRVE